MRDQKNHKILVFVGIVLTRATGPIDALTTDLEEVASATAFERSKPGKKSWAKLMALIKESPVEKDWQQTVD